MSERSDTGHRHDGASPEDSGAHELDPSEPRPGAGEPSPFEVVTYLWPEYNYRHDMVWKLVFRVTAVATALLIAPFLASETTQRILKGWLIFLPILALAVIIAGSLALWPELKLLSKVKDVYRCEQNSVLRKVPGWEPHRPKVHRNFNTRVWAFMVVLFLAAVAYLFIFRFAWLPHLTKPNK